MTHPPKGSNKRSTIISKEIWESGLAQRLDKPQPCKEVCDLIYTDAQTTVLPYLSAANEPAVQTAFMANAAARNTLSNVIAPGVMTMATETLAIVSMEYVAQYVDTADQVQAADYVKDREIGDLLGKKIGERLEALVLAAHADWTNFGDTGSGVLGLADTTFTVDPNNIDNVILGVTEQVNAANGANLAKEFGKFIVWRAADWTYLLQFMMSNGFSLADYYLKNGADVAGVYFADTWHYMSTGHTANHLFAGVRKMMKVGLLTKTFGKVNAVEKPASSTAGYLRGTNYETFLDYGFKTQTNIKPIVFDVRVN